MSCLTLGGGGEENSFRGYAPTIFTQCVILHVHCSLPPPPPTVGLLPGGLAAVSTTVWQGGRVRSERPWVTLHPSTWCVAAFYAAVSAKRVSVRYVPPLPRTYSWSYSVRSTHRGSTQKRITHVPLCTLSVTRRCLCMRVEIDVPHGNRSVVRPAKMQYLRNRDVQQTRVESF